MKRNDSFSVNNQATKKPRTLSDVRIKRPGPFDVICGRGRPYQEHHGNKRLHRIAAMYKPRYFKSKRTEKKGIAETIVNSIKNDETEPGRFLKRTDDEDDEVWEEVSLANASEKVSHVLRFKSTRSSQPPRTKVSASMKGFQSKLATNQQILEPRQHPREPLPAFGFPVAGSNASAVQPPLHSTLNVQRAALLNCQRPDVGGVDTISWMLSGTVGTAGAPPMNVNETLPINLLSDEQVFLLEALIQRRRLERTNITLPTRP
jgi:hypothetical protein